MSGYHPEGKKRGLTEVYMPPSNSPLPGLECDLHTYERATRRRFLTPHYNSWPNESGSGVTSGTCTYSAPSPPHAPTLFTPAALKAMKQEVPVLRKPSDDAGLDLLLKKAQDYEIDVRAALDAAERGMHEAKKRAAILASDLLHGTSRGLKLKDLVEEQQANAAEKARVVEEAGVTSPDLQRKLAESRAHADAAEVKKDALLRRLSHESSLDCPPHDDVERQTPG
ncbi:unnamed protein product [Ectocarpus sp. 12 AP-2014]